MEILIGKKQAHLLCLLKQDVVVHSVKPWLEKKKKKKIQ